VQSQQPRPLLPLTPGDVGLQPDGVDHWPKSVHAIALRAPLNTIGCNGWQWYAGLQLRRRRGGAVMQPTSDHNRIDARNLAFHRLIAVKIAADPSIIVRAMDWLRDEDLASYTATHEWADVLSWPVAKIIEFLNGDTEKLVRLCQSTPFLGVITEEERRSINESHGIRARYPSGERHLRGQ
jgi:hypothetical protein